MSIDYLQLLRHPFWQKKKNGILDRDKYTCQRCTDTLSNLQVHHLYYKKDTNPWDYPDEALITLCDLCHAKAEFYKWMEKEGQYCLQRLGLSYADRHEVMSMITNKVRLNHYREEVLKYIDDIKRLLTDG